MRFPMILAATAGLWVAAAAQPVTRSDSDQTTEVYLTVYNTDLALVREVRDVPLPAGTLNLEYADVAARIDPTTVHITSTSHPGELAVLEQNYEYDLLSPDRLLENFVGREIRIRTPLGAGSEAFEERTGTLMSVQGGRIVRTEDGIILDPRGEISIIGDVGDLRSEPTLVWLLESGAEATQTLEASYLTNGISWEADYVVVVNDTDTEADLTGWVTINNQSGATYTDARLKLVAGDVHRVQQPQEFMMIDRAMYAGVAAAAPQFQEQTFFEYHLYTLQRPTTVRDRQTKQMTLLTAEDFAITKRYIYESPMNHPGIRRNTRQDEPDHIAVVIDFENSEENGMGMPLPRGDVRLYRADSDGALQFIGEDRIDHTPRDEDVRLRVGEAFDIVGERVQTDYRELFGDRVEQDWSVTVRNHKDEDITVTLVEHMTGDWSITRSSAPHEQTASDTFEFTVDVPADGEVEVTYTVHILLD